jgi:hypothetical protein
MRYVKVVGNFAYQHPGNRLEVVEPGSVVPIHNDADAEQFVRRGLGSFHPGPENLIRPLTAEAVVERPGFDARPSRAEKAVAAPQRAGAV